MGASLPWVDAVSLPAREGRERIGISGMLRRHRATSLACPTALGQTHVWGQQQCHGITETAANVVVSVQGEMNGDIQVELYPYLFHVFVPVPWSPG